MPCFPLTMAVGSPEAQSASIDVVDGASEGAVADVSGHGSRRIALGSFKPPANDIALHSRIRHVTHLSLQSHTSRQINPGSTYAVIASSASNEPLHGPNELSAQASSDRARLAAQRLRSNTRPVKPTSLTSTLVFSRRNGGRFDMDSCFGLSQLFYVGLGLNNNQILLPQHVLHALKPNKTTS